MLGRYKLFFFFFLSFFFTTAAAAAFLFIHFTRPFPSAACVACPVNRPTDILLVIVVVVGQRDEKKIPKGPSTTLLFPPPPLFFCGFTSAKRMRREEEERARLALAVAAIYGGFQYSSLCFNLCALFILFSVNASPQTRPPKTRRTEPADIFTTL